MNPKRRFFQIHLSTAVVLMLVAGVFAKLDFAPSVETNEINHPGGNTVYLVVHRYGWPLEYHAGSRIDRKPANQPRTFGQMGYGPVRNDAALWDFLVAFSILFALWRVSEWIIWRRSPNGMPFDWRLFTQVHRSTAVILILLAAPYFCVNAWPTIYEPQFNSSNPVVVEDYGWPFHIASLHYAPESREEPIARYFDYVAILWNTLLLSGILLCVWKISEWRIRRRAARKANE